MPLLLISYPIRCQIIVLLYIPIMRCSNSQVWAITWSLELNTCFACNLGCRYGLHESCSSIIPLNSLPFTELQRNCQTVRSHSPFLCGWASFCNKRPWAIFLEAALRWWAYNDKCVVHYKPRFTRSTLYLTTDLKDGGLKILTCRILRSLRYKW